MKLPRVPEHLAQTHELRKPKSMFITGDIESSHQIWDIYSDLNETTLFTHNCLFFASMETLVMTLPYGKGKRRIRQEHPGKLAAGIGLRPEQSTEAMFVGPKLRKVSNEGLVWLGRAMASSHIERVYYLDPSDDAKGLSHVDGLADSPDLRVIHHPLEVFSHVSVEDGSEIGVFDPLPDFTKDKVTTEDIK
ncbi:MAG: hypothetical protein M3P98_02360 [bacterium]|nr:hypothetical protein [bacterium]